MKLEAHRWFSPSLGHEMGCRLYGQAGKPILAFPSQGGGCFEWEAFGMLEVLDPWLESGQACLITVDGVDLDSWCHPSADVEHRAWKHGCYERYILEEVLPLVRQRCGEARLLTTGCSMGAYHAANFFFRHPRIFDGVLSLSGIYQLKLFLGDYMNQDVYLHSPLAYLPNLQDEAILAQYRRSQIVLAVGQGAWEQPMLDETLAMRAILEAKSIPAWVDVWGHDVAHDWPWWRRMIVRFLPEILKPYA